MARQKLVHLHTDENRAPSASVLNYGEIAVQHNAADAALYIKTGEDAVEKFISEKGVRQLISASTVDYLALKSEVVTVGGSLEALQAAAITGLTVNDIDATVAENVATVEIDTDDIKVGTAVTYSGDTFIGTTATTTQALQALSDKIKTIDGVVSESNHGHENKAVLDGIDSADVENWDNAFASAHTHDNKAVLDGIDATDVENWDTAFASAHTHANQALLDTYTQTEAALADAVSKAHEHANASVLDGIDAESVAAWDDAAAAIDGKVDKENGKGLSKNDYTDAEKTKLEGIASGAQANVIETVKVNGTALTVTDKAVDILVAEGTQNGTVKVNGSDIAVHGLGSAAYQDTTAFDASGAAETAKSELIGDMTGATKTLGGLEDRIDSLTTGSNVSISTATTTEGYLKSYTFSQNGSEIGTIDIPKDLVVTSGQIVEVNDVKYLRLTIANQDSPVDIAVSDLVDVYTQGNGIEISTGNVISAKVVAGNGLSLDSNGIAMAAASANGAGAMSSADFVKLAGIASGAQVNTLEGVQVNGADLTPDANKKVNVTVTSGVNNGTISVNGSDVAVTGLKSAAYAETSAFDASGAAAAAKSEVIGDMSGDTKTLGALQGAIAALDLGDHNVIEEVQVNGTALTVTDKAVNITITGGTQDGTIAVNGSDVAVTGLGGAAFEPIASFDTAGAAEAASAAAITAVVGTASSSGNTLGALESRMDTMHVGDDNVIEGVQVNGSDLTVDANKKVNVTVTAGTADGTIAVNGTDVAVTGLGSAAYEDATAFDAAGAAAAASAAAYSSATSYTDAAIANMVTGATGDTYVSATASNGVITVGATQNLTDAITAANASVQGIESGKESGVHLNASRELDFSELGIDCGTY